MMDESLFLDRMFLWNGCGCRHAGVFDAERVSIVFRLFRLLAAAGRPAPPPVTYRYW